MARHRAKTPAKLLVPKRKKSGIPTGNAGEYFVMGKLLRRGFDAQLADRNTKGYDLLVGTPADSVLEKVQVKAIRAGRWWVNPATFTGKLRNRVTVYVLVGSESARKPVRYFIARNSALARRITRHHGWNDHAFMSMKAVEPHEDRWDVFGRIRE